MGTENKLNCHTENTALGTKSFQNLELNTSLDNGSCSTPNSITLVTNNFPIQHQQSSSSEKSVETTAVPFLPIEIEENAVIQGVTEILKVIRPSWDLGLVEFKKFTDGITNKLIGCFYNPLNNHSINSLSNGFQNIIVKNTNSQNSNNDTDSESLSNADSETETMMLNLKLMTTSNQPRTNNVVLVRIFGSKTDLLIDRKAETRNIILLHSHGFAPSLYATFKNGLVYDFVPGVTLNSESVLRPEVWPLVAQRMADMHRIVKPICDQDDITKQVPMLWKKAQSFLDLVPVQYTDPNKHKRIEGTFLPITRMRLEFADLYKRLEALGSPLVFSHNDLLLGNVIYTELSKTVTFIDYEYADLNYQAFDIGNHFAEFAGVDTVDYTLYPTRDFQLKWLRVYLQAYLQRSQISDAELETLYVQVNQFALAAHLFWTIWCLIQAEHSTIDFDYVEYAFIRYREYLAKKEAFLALDTNLPKCKI